MPPRIRRFEQHDEQVGIELSLRAWAPVFASLADLLGESGICAQLHPDWRADQHRAMQDTCRCEHTTIWVAGVGSVIAGFVTVQLDHEASIGQMYMIAVEPNYQRDGVAAQLTETALDWIRRPAWPWRWSKPVANAGHAPARGLYEHAGFTQLPLARYFKKL